jgi:hypothetical protein
VGPERVSTTQPPLRQHTQHQRQQQQHAQQQLDQYHLHNHQQQQLLHSHTGAQHPAASSASSASSSTNNNNNNNAAQLAALLGNPFTNLPGIPQQQQQQQHAHQQQQHRASQNLSPMSQLRHHHQHQQQQARLLSRPDSFDDLFLPGQSALPGGGAALSTTDFSSFYPLTLTSQQLQQQQQQLQQQLVAAAILPPPTTANNHAILPKLPQYEEPWLEEIQLNVSSISLEPMSGIVVLERIREKLNDVLTRYIVCVDFLVQCQQDLRKGLEYANNQKRYSRGNRGMTAAQFYKTYVEPLARSFFAKHQNRMETNALQAAYAGLDKLQRDAKNAERQGCEAVKSTFLGGMKDGESWGLRKWLSTHGSGLSICTDLECILGSCQKLDRAAESTKQLAKLLRPMAQQVLDKLHSDIPSSYQQHSTAHPYLPFFHRVESALRGIANFDPEDDDVICLDSDSDDNDVQVEIVSSSFIKPAHKAPSHQPKKKRASQAALRMAESAQAKKRASSDHCSIDTVTFNAKNGKKPATVLLNDDSSSSGESECSAVIDIIDAKPIGQDDWVCPTCSAQNAANNITCFQCGEESLLRDLGNLGSLLGFDDYLDKRGTPGSFDSIGLQSVPPYQENGGTELVNGSHDAVQKSLVPVWTAEQPELSFDKASMIADNLDRLAVLFDQNQQDEIRAIKVNGSSFWDEEHYASALRLFADVLRTPEAPHFLELADDDSAYCQIIKHPICLRQIAQALLGDDLRLNAGLDGAISTPGLSSWNMWHGKDLLQAIDLVFVNKIAYTNVARNGTIQSRSLTNRIRKFFWNGVANIIGQVDADTRKRCYPVKRSEKSGFVVFKGDDN